MKTEPNNAPHPTALIVFVRIQAWTPAADGLFVRLNFAVSYGAR